MNHTDIERAFSRPRFNRYLKACDGNLVEGYKLYQTNIRLSFKVFAVISVFEITLKNAIDEHYKSRFGMDWLLHQSGPFGFLAFKGCEKSRENVLATIQKLGQDYSHDKTVADLNFAFWRNLFGPKEYQSAGSTLLNIFSNKPEGKTYHQTYVLNKLRPVNDIRNRVAHHDPICFLHKSNVPSFDFTLEAHRSIKELLVWLDFDPAEILAGVDFVEEEIRSYFK